MKRFVHRLHSPPEFIAWDGEGTSVQEPVTIETAGRFDPNGKPVYYWEHEYPKPDFKMFLDYQAQPQPYVLLANSKGNRIINKDGLPTIDCLEFLLQAKRHNKNSIFVGFGFNYDINQILKDLTPECLLQLHATNQTFWYQYWIKWLPRKSLQIKHGKSKRSVIIYDVFGFFQSSFLTACNKYIGTDDPRLQQIEQGKAARTTFDFSELEEFIIPYNKLELTLLVEMMNKLRHDFHQAGIFPSRWHGPGAIAGEVLKKYGVQVSRDIPKEVGRAAQHAYAGGRFEQFRMGRYGDTVYEYDIRSAYPAAIAQLPDISKGTWEHVERWEPDTFGVWRIEYKSPDGVEDNKPQPLFRRAEDGSVSYPIKVEGWYWTPEASLVPDSVKEGYVFRPATDNRPFAFIEAMYEQRRLLKDPAHYSPTERAIKLIINSVYGKLAQTIGGKEGPPTWHQLEWAGYITSYTRAKIYRAIQLNQEAIIAAETDAVFSTEPLDLPLSDKLGDWEQKEYKSIVYLQSGFYYADTGSEIVCKYRGMDRDGETKQPLGLPYRVVLDHLHHNTGLSDRSTPPLFSHTTRFIGLGLGLKTKAVWRSWEKKQKAVRIDSIPWSVKRFHMSEHCAVCDQGISMYQQAHPMLIGGYMGRSYARALPWVDNSEAVGGNLDEYVEENPEFRYFGEEQDKWQ